MGVWQAPSNTSPPNRMTNLAIDNTTAGAKLTWSNVDLIQLQEKFHVCSAVQPPPMPPSSFTASMVSSSSVTLSWTDTSGDMAGFQIQRRVGTGNFMPVTSPSPGTTSFQDSVQASTTYSYRIRAVDSSTNASSYVMSTPVSVTTPSNGNGALAAPQNLTATADNTPL